MRLRDIVVAGAAAGLLLGVTFATAEETTAAADQAPLPAGGPAAQGEAGGGMEIIEVGGILVAVSLAGLVALNSDDDSPPATTATTP